MNTSFFTNLTASFLPTDIFIILFLTAQILFILAVTTFTLSAVDDLLLDLYYCITCAYRRIRGQTRDDALSENLLLKEEEQYLAIMLPAWQEAGILLPSVSKIVQTIQYSHVHIFIGTYPNDLDTQREAEQLSCRYENVHKVVTPLPGPTCKADCLNAVIQAIKEFGHENSIDFKGFILHDAEDVVHPLSLKLYNHYLAEYDLIQIPVLSLPREWKDLTGGHYMDEFAEVHSKEVKARQYLAHVVPGAGVGTAYSKRVLEYAQEHGEIFNTSSLTEDYEFSFRLSSAGFKQIFAHTKLPNRQNHGRTEILATRELFPNTFWAAVRQKTRWIIGISLQGWASLGWKGPLLVKFLYWRDRKTLFFSHAVVAGFLATLIFSSCTCYENLFPEAYRMPPLLPEDSYFWTLVHVNIAILVYRLVQRSFWTWKCYGWLQVPLVAPRYVWGALINYLATVRAIKIYLTHCITGKTIGWDKTTHDFPDEEVHQPFSESKNSPLPGYTRNIHGVHTSPYSS
ncbi:glycosyltransferase [Desulfogranum japonicum]|uniref:glycosyltransferase n=1 Tax=Desulfogranum japonicum TaxID=231447 RepID=UPI0003FF305D|nr:glycosyltransferase [Desulfogranum japonicum]